MGRAANVGVANVRHSLCLGSKSASRGVKGRQCSSVSKVTGESTGPYEAAQSGLPVWQRQCGGVGERACFTEWKSSI